MSVVFLLIWTSCKINNNTDMPRSDSESYSALLSESDAPEIEIEIENSHSSVNEISNSKSASSSASALNSTPAYTPPQDISKADPNPVHIKTVNLKIVAVGEVLFDGKISWEEKDTAFSVLKRYATDNNISITHRKFFGDEYVSEFAGYKEKASGYPNSGWTYCYNGERGKKACSAQKVEPGDSVLWEYSLENKIN